MARFLKFVAILGGLGFLLLLLLILLGPILMPMVIAVPTMIQYTAAPILLAVFAPRLLLRLRRFLNMEHHWELVAAQALLLGVFSLILMFMLLTRMHAVNVLDLATSNDSDGFSTPVLPAETRMAMVQRRGAVINELWISLSLMPRWRGGCFNGDAEVCRLANTAQTTYQGRSYSPMIAYRWTLGLSLVVGLTGGGMVLYSATSPRPEIWRSHPPEEETETAA